MSVLYAGSVYVARSRYILLIFAFAILLYANGRLASSIFSSKKEMGGLSERLNYLSERSCEAEKQFALKQDHMRKMLTDSDFVESVVRQREGYIKQNEMVFKFED
jgi:cell division protein FtsB